MKLWAIAFFLLSNPDVTHPVKIGGFESKKDCETYRSDLNRRIVLGGAEGRQHFGNRCERGGGL
jgi:hypothetical protein